MAELTKLQSFYKSRKWETFIKALKAERRTADGSIICEHCGKPILKAYDCIAHHKTELTEQNVDDAAIALDPENIMLIHFRCHNELHKRFGFGTQEKKPRAEKKVFIVYGAPCAGKSTWVNSVANSGDIILDIDRLWAAIRAGRCGAWEKPSELKQNVFALRDLMLDMISTRRGRWECAYIIGGYPYENEREQLAATVGADKVVFIDTPKEVCLERAKLKAPEWETYIETWFERAESRA